MNTYYTLSNLDYSVKVSKDFVESCKVFTNLFEDTGNRDNSESIPITDSFNETDFKMYIQFFEDMNSLKVKNDNGEILSYLDYIIDFRNEYIENYTNKHLDPPHINEVCDIFTKLGNDNLKKIIDIDKYFDNKKIIRGLMLCIAISICKLDKDIDDDEDFESYEQRKEQAECYLLSIINNIY